LLTILEFAIALIVILAGAAFFTNAVEILGGRLGMGQGAVGLLPLPLFVKLAVALFLVFGYVLYVRRTHVSGTLVYLVLRRTKKLRARRLMAGGVFYLLFVIGAVV